MDIEDAFENAGLTELERAIVKALYFDPPKCPVRKADKNGNAGGRPAGATTLKTVAEEIAQDPRFLRKIMPGTIATIKNKAIMKMVKYLGLHYA